MKHLLSERDLNRAQFDYLVERARTLKKWFREKREYKPLKGKVLGMIFEKASTRTRLSFEVAMIQMGGNAIYMNSRDTQMGRGESIADTARVMSRYLDAIMIRTFAQEIIEEFARHATIPVINGLTDLLHPCQVLSDVFTIVEKKGSYEKLKLAFIGDGNNVANSWLNVATILPIHVRIACPQGYEPDQEIFRRAQREAIEGIVLCRDPKEAVQDVDVIYTDVWTSMGKEEEYEKRIQVFQSYQVNSKLLTYASRDVMIMHCLPAHRGEEITSDVLDGRHSVVLDQAENRLHMQKAILEMLLTEDNL
ncbi:MAG: ornithine carbamoyltransferase [Syntrophales bacterium]|nr:ornithine carbamoyltransferase [Syntrophales bacterium]